MEIICRNLKHCSRSPKETAYISLVRSVLNYAAVVWDPCQKKDMDRLEGIQRRAALFVCNDYGRYISVSKMMKELKWQPLSEHRRDQRLLLLYKIVYGLVAIPADSLFQFKNRPPRTQHSKSINVLSCDTDLYKNPFVPATIKDRNSLTTQTINCKSTEQL